MRKNGLGQELGWAPPFGCVARGQRDRATCSRRRDNGTTTYDVWGQWSFRRPLTTKKWSTVCRVFLRQQIVIPCSIRWQQFAGISFTVLEGLAPLFETRAARCNRPSERHILHLVSDGGRGSRTDSTVGSRRRRGLLARECLDGLSPLSG